ncbi:ABC transporter permease [Sediminibacillus albus]|uniref:Transport permease protein n=1 Tax=Sediminibacillus albus TaxID=407036 RepID=A0A1G8ZH33_9BACI|nr:ABC transporter permease [Sediminibacillus albus]SDK13705.1 teichoic acid transport system permease protein [Sediminibacillus albus]
MKTVINIINQQLFHFPLIIRLALYETKSKYQMHFLGVLWQFINPLLQVAVYWFVFGVGIRNGIPVEGTPFFIWLLMGLVPWFFISPTIVQGSNSIYSKINLVSKMKFPVSILPSITIVSNIFGFLITVIILGIVMFIYRIPVSIYALQLPYYLVCLFLLLYSITLFTSTISALIRDFQLLIQTLMRLLFFMTPILWSIEEFPGRFHTLIELNPFAYIVNGFRESLLSGSWFYEDWRYTIYFWSFTLLILFVGSLLHENYKNKFVDYL